MTIHGIPWSISKRVLSNCRILELLKWKWKNAFFIFRQIQSCERLRDAFSQKKAFFFLRWHQGRCFESQHSFPLKKHHKNWWIGKNGIKCPFHFSSNSRLWDYAMPSTQKKDFFFLKMAPRPSFWKSTQFSSAGTCIEKVHLNAKPQNFFWNKNQSLVIFANLYLLCI